jgi:predicted amidohydrolase
MSQSNPFIVAGLQCDPQIARPDLNLEMISALAERAKDTGAALAIFPECAVTGYCFDSAEEAMEVAEPVPGPATVALEEIAVRLNIHLVAGMIERSKNRLFNAAVNRVGTECGVRFIGRSSIIDPFGKVLASADDSEQMLIAEIAPSLARDKHIVRVPGEHEIDRLKDRRPDQYGLLTQT